MNHAKHTVCYSGFVIPKLKRTNYVKGTLLFHRRSLYQSYFLSSILDRRGTNGHLQNRFGITSSPALGFQCSNSSFGSIKADDLLDEEKDLATDILTNLKAAQIEKRDKRSIFYKSESKDEREKRIINGPGLNSFMPKNTCSIDNQTENVPYLQNLNGNHQKVYLEIYGCQMNFNDAEVVSAILKKNDYDITSNMMEANIILLITCAIRDSAEQKIWNKLISLRRLKKRNKAIKIGLLGCMAERLKHKIIEEEKIVDIVAGPDTYKDLPRLLAISNDHNIAINVALSFDETYADVTPVRLNPDSKTAYVSIMRGCNNMCTYCIVPFTRGKERSRPVDSILSEVKQLSEQGIKEITLLGQNVNSYRDLSQKNVYMDKKTSLAKGFKTVYKNQDGGLRFSDLLDKVSLIDPEMRIRFTSPHPKDFPDEVLHLIAERPNICQQIHLPAQSGNNNVLERMRRGYTREAYLELVYHIRNIIPRVALSSDFIAGFCDETEEEFNETLTLMNEVKYTTAYLFQYSMREKTTAHRRFIDNVDEKVKHSRLLKMVKLYRTEVEKIYRSQIGHQQLILVEGKSKRSAEDLQGRNNGNIKVIFPNGAIPQNNVSPVCKPIQNGDYVVVHICNANSQILRGIPLYHSSIREYYSLDSRSQALRC